MLIALEKSFRNLIIASIPVSARAVGTKTFFNFTCLSEDDEFQLNSKYNGFKASCRCVGKLFPHGKFSCYFK